MQKMSMVLACAFLSLGADNPADKGTELAKFQDSWTTTKATVAGADIPASSIKELDMTIKGDQAIPKRDPTDSATLKIDASKKPAEIDFVDSKNKVDRGIYRFVDNDTLEICVDIDGGPRPGDFAAPKESKRVLLEMKRSK